jgi:hypothetical protein
MCTQRQQQQQVQEEPHEQPPEVSPGPRATTCLHHIHRFTAWQDNIENFAPTADPTVCKDKEQQMAKEFERPAAAFPACFQCIKKACSRLCTHRRHIFPLPTSARVLYLDRLPKTNVSFFGESFSFLYFSCVLLGAFFSLIPWQYIASKGFVVTIILPGNAKHSNYPAVPCTSAPVHLNSASLVSCSCTCCPLYSPSTLRICLLKLLVSSTNAFTTPSTLLL